MTTTKLVLLTREQEKVLFIVANADEKLNVIKIAQISCMEQYAASSVLRSLVRKGHVAEKRSESLVAPILTIYSATERGRNYLEVRKESVA